MVVALVSASFLVTLAPEMTTFATAITCLGRIWAIFRNVARSVALVTGKSGRAIVNLLGAVPCQVSWLVAFVASRIVRLGAVFRDMSYAVATVAPLGLLWTRASKVSILIAFVALLTVAATAHIATAVPTTSISTASVTHSGITITGIVTRTITLVARG